MELNAPFLRYAVDGIDDALITPAPERGDSSDLRTLLHAATALLAATDEDSIRVVVGSRTVVVQQEGAHAAAVTWVTGHDVAKSVRRTIRRLAQRPTSHPRKVPRYQLEAQQREAERALLAAEGARDGTPSTARLARLRDRKAELEQLLAATPAPDPCDHHGDAVVADAHPER
jgi:phage shock protein A